MRAQTFRERRLSLSSSGGGFLIFILARKIFADVIYVYTFPLDRVTCSILGFVIIENGRLILYTNLSAVVLKLRENNSETCHVAGKWRLKIEHHGRAFASLQ